MKYGFKAGFLFTLSVSLAPLAANAYPVSLQAPQRARAAAPIVKTDFDYGGGWHPRSGYWRPRYFIYEWRPRPQAMAAGAGTMAIAGIIAIIAGARTTASAILVNARAHAMGADGTID